MAFPHARFRRPCNVSLVLLLASKFCAQYLIGKFWLHMNMVCCDSHCSCCSISISTSPAGQRATPHRTAASRVQWSVPAQLTARKRSCAALGAASAQPLPSAHKKPGVSNKRRQRGPTWWSRHSQQHIRQSARATAWNAASADEGAAPSQSRPAGIMIINTIATRHTVIECLSQCHTRANVSLVAVSSRSGHAQPVVHTGAHTMDTASSRNFVS